MPNVAVVDAHTPVRLLLASDIIDTVVVRRIGPLIYVPWPPNGYPAIVSETAGQMTWGTGDLTWSVAIRVTVIPDAGMLCVEETATPRAGSVLNRRTAPRRPIQWPVRVATAKRWGRRRQWTGMTRDLAIHSARCALPPDLGTRPVQTLTLETPARSWTFPIREVRRTLQDRHMILVVQWDGDPEWITW